MPRLTAVTVMYGPTLDVLFTTTIPLLGACETASLQLTDASRSGSELGIRIERGAVVDFYLWDAEKRVRQRLPGNEVVINGRYISCVIPTALLPSVHGSPRLEAALVVNGAASQSRFPVRITTWAPAAREPMAARSKF